MPSHPDTPERLIAIERAVGEREWPAMERREAPAAKERELELIHRPAHVESIRELGLPEAAPSTPTHSSARPPTGPPCTPPEAPAR